MSSLGALRLAAEHDVASLTHLINIAFKKESFFKKGDRIDEAGVREKLETGSIYVLEESGAIIACVYIETHGGLSRGPGAGYIGLLAVDPARQGSGLGRYVMHFAEQELVRRGCVRAQLRIINLRTELLAFYRKSGYRETDTTPYPAPENLSQPVHFVNMEKEMK